MAQIQNNFSWSFSRHKCLEDCPRKYYWTYYGYWNGWSADAPDEARLAYRLKKMTNLPMWLGDLVHRMIERILGDLQNRQLNSIEAYQKQLRAWMNKEWKQSVDGGWKWKPKWNLNLYEHYYGVEIPAEQRYEAREKVYRSLQNFMQSELFEELGELRPEGWKSVEALDQFQVGGHPVYVKLDLATQPRPEAACLYDWKTGKESADTAIQLGCYALYAHDVWGVPLENQKLISFYLDNDKLIEHRPSAEELIETKDFILQSMEHMQAGLASDPSENLARIEDFPMTESRGKCRSCFFRELCYDSREWPPPSSPGA